MELRNAQLVARANEALALTFSPPPLTFPPDPFNSDPDDAFNVDTNPGPNPDH